MSVEDKVKSAESKVLHLFQSKMQSIQYVFRDGETAIFRAGKFATSKIKYVKELMEEVENGHPHIFVDPNQTTITQEELAPDYQLREQIRAEERAKLIAEQGKDFGSSGQQGGANTGVASTASIKEATVGNNEGAIITLAQSQAQSKTPGAQVPVSLLIKK